MKGFRGFCGISGIMGSFRNQEVGVVKGLREGVKVFSEKASGICD